MRNLTWLAALAMLALVGCTSMDQRSDEPERKPLLAISSPLDITRKWATDTGEGTNNKDIKLLLVKDHNRLYTVDACGKVIAINENTGIEEWTLNLKAPVSAGPAVAEGKLVVGTNDGRVIAVDLKECKVAWSSKTSSEILAAPKISGTEVFVHTMDGGLSAFSLIDGRQLWRFTHNLPPLMLRRSSTPEVSGDLVVAGFANGKLLAMQKNDGTVTWTQDISNPKGTTDLQRMVDISADPVIHGDRVYAASYQGNIAALTISNGQVIWERGVPSFSGFIVDHDLIYVASTSGDVVALDAQSGSTYWQQNELQGRYLSKPAAMDKYVVVADDDGNIFWLDKTNGKIVARQELDKDGIEATPIVHNNIVYILGRSGELVALEVV